MAREPEPFLSFVPYRRAEWKGHATKKNVRNVIRCNDEDRLYLFALEGGRYVEITPGTWETYFAEGD